MRDDSKSFRNLIFYRQTIYEYFYEKTPAVLYRFLNSTKLDDNIFIDVNKQVFLILELLNQISLGQKISTNIKFGGYIAITNFDFVLKKD